jgi:uncharacterized integral membrane protein (TIGR00698 family)
VRSPLATSATDYSGTASTGTASTTSVVPGLALASGGAAVGLAVHEWWPSVSAHVVAVLVGVVIGNLSGGRERLAPGLRFAGRHVLRAGIAVLGLRLSWGEIADLGPSMLAAVVAVVIATFVGTRLLARLLGVPPGFALLVATGYSICGASAIAAAEPFADASEEEVAYSIALVALCGSLAIGVLPVVGGMLGLSSDVFGAWVGASVHDVGQVVAAASTRDQEAVRAAVVVKLTRVALLAPLLGAVAIEAQRRRRRVAPAGSPTGSPTSEVRRPPLLPWFVVAFLAAAALRSADLVPHAGLDAARHVETFLIGAGLVGLGSQVVWQRLRTLGGRPLLLGAASWALVALTSLAAVQLAS